MLSVKISKIPEAGYGLFVQCTLLLCDFGDNSELPAFFHMQTGKLLNLGIHALLLLEDKEFKKILGETFYLFLEAVVSGGSTQQKVIIIMILQMT